MSWRIRNQEKYLNNKQLIKIDVSKFKSKLKNDGLFHEHCEFCFEKIENLEEAYCTKNFYHWICPKCYNDFLNQFNMKEIKYKYFVLNYQRKGTSYHEFVFGKQNDKHWNDYSLYVSDDIMQKIQLYKIFEDNVKEYQYYGSTIVDTEKWKKILGVLNQYSVEVQEAINEIKEWVTYSIEKYKCFSILGI